MYPWRQASKSPGTIAATERFATVGKQGVRMKKTAQGRGLAGEAAVARIVQALERLAPAALSEAMPDSGSAFVWEPAEGGLIAVPHVAGIELTLLKGVES